MSTAPRALVLNPDDSVAPPEVLERAIADLDALLTNSRNDSFAPFDAEPHPLELGPDRSDGWVSDPGTSIDIGLPDVKHLIRDLSGRYIKTFCPSGAGWEGAAPRAWHIANRLLAEDALQQMTASLRTHGPPPKRAVRSWRRMFSLFYHGILSLPIQLRHTDDGLLVGEMLSMELSCPDLFSPTESTFYHQWLVGFAYGRILEAPPIYRLSRQLGQDRLKEELAALFLRPWNLWPQGIMPKTRSLPPGRVRRSFTAKDDGLRGRTEWLAGRIRRADETFRRADKKLLDECDHSKPSFSEYLLRRLPILKRRMDIAHMHGGFVLLLPNTAADAKTMAAPSADSPAEQLRAAVLLAYAPFQDGPPDPDAALQAVPEEIESLGVAATITAILGPELTRDLLQKLEYLAWWPRDRVSRDAPAPPDTPPPAPYDMIEKRPWTTSDRLWSIVGKDYFKTMRDPVAESYG